MSLRAMLWVMNDAPANNHAELAILYALAERADDTGRCSWPSQEWIADRARCSTRTVRRHLQAMEDRGLIHRGDQRFVAHIRKDRRPIVWNINLRARREAPPTVEDIDQPATGQDDPSTGGQDDRTQEQRPDTGGTTAGHSGTHGRTATVERPDTAVSYKPSLTVHEPSMNQPPVVPQGGHDEAGNEIEAVSDSTPAAPGGQETKTGSTKSRGTRLPEKFFPTDHTINLIRAQFPGITEQFLIGEHAKFLDHWAAAPGAKGRKVDWEATWRNWIRNSIDRLRPAERAMFTQQAQPAAPQAPQQPSKADQYRDIGDMIAAEFAPGGDGQ